MLKPSLRTLTLASLGYLLVLIAIGGRQLYQDVSPLTLLAGLAAIGLAHAYYRYAQRFL